MSWLIRVENGLEIRTGDGRTFNPSYVNAQYDFEFNISSFDFNEINGSLVRRKRPKGRSFNMLIIFQGEDHLDETEAFRLSSFDQRPWTISHPLYGQVKGHPRGLGVDNSKFNVSRISFVFLETIEDSLPQASISPIDSIESKKVVLDEQIVVNYETTADELTGVEATQITDSLEDTKAEAKKIAIGDAVAGITNAVNTAINSVTVGIGKVEGFILDVQTAINYPFTIAAQVKARINSFEEAFNRLTGTIDNLTSTNNEKRYYEANGASGIGAAAAAAVNQIEEYPYSSRTEVDEVNAKIVTLYETFVTKLDEIQADSATAEEAYVPDKDVILQLQSIVDLTVSRLFEVALKAKQEQTLVLEEESDPVNVAHRIYGLTPTDEELEAFVENNTIGVNELFLLPKGKQIVYYI